MLLPATWEMISLKKKPSATEKACLQLISSLIQIVGQSHKSLCWHSEEPGTWAGRRDEDCLFWWNCSFKRPSKQRLHCLCGVVLLRMLQIGESFCIKGQSGPLDSSFGSFIWKPLAQSWGEKSADFKAAHKKTQTWKLLEIKSALTYLISGMVLESSVLRMGRKRGTKQYFLKTLPRFWLSPSPLMRHLVQRSNGVALYAASRKSPKAQLGSAR